MRRRGASQHPQRGDPGELGGDLLGHPGAEVLLRGILREVAEGKHRHHTQILVRRVFAIVPPAPQAQQRKGGERDRQADSGKQEPARRSACREESRSGAVGECGGKGGGGVEAIGGQPLQRPMDGPIDRGRDGASLRGEGGSVRRHHPGHDGLGRHAGEWRCAQQHLVEDTPQREDIAPRVDRPFPHRLLGGHVLWRAERHAGLGEAGAAGGRGGERDAEVGHQGVPTMQQDVLRFDVAVDHAVLVGVLQRVGDFPRDLDGGVHGELLLAVQPIAQGFALDEGHHVEQEGIGDPGIEQRQDVRVLQVRGGLDLAQKPLGPDDRGQFRAQHLDRDLAMVLQILGEKDGGHAARAQLPLE